MQDFTGKEFQFKTLAMKFTTQHDLQSK